MANIPCNDPRHNCGTHFGSRSLFVSKVANVQSTPYPNPRVLFYPSRERTLGTRLVLPLLLKPHANGRDATLLANNSQHCWISHVVSVCTPTLLLEVVAQSLKPVKRLSTCKRTQQLPTCWANNVGSF